MNRRTAAVMAPDKGWRRLCSAWRTWMRRGYSRLVGRSGLPIVSPEEGYDRWADTYGEQLNPVQELESRALARLLPSMTDATILDLGCGRGRCSALALSRGAAKTVGVDISQRMLEAAAQTVTSARANWTRGNATDLAFADESFDLVVSSLMMGHVRDLKRAIAEIGRVLRPGGTLVLSDFHPFSSLRGMVRSFYDEREGRSLEIRHHLHTFSDYVRCLAGSGLTLEMLEEPTYEGWPMVFVLRARKREASHERVQATMP